jgi:hypothetical protein
MGDSEFEMAWASAEFEAEHDLAVDLREIITPAEPAKPAGVAEREASAGRQQ